MTRDELIAAVPAHEINGRPTYIDVSDIPQPWRDQFWAGLFGATIPVIKGVERAAYVWDWHCWAGGYWYGGVSGPVGLEVDPAIMQARHRLANYPALAACTEGRIHADRLDGETCRRFYEAALPGIDWKTVHPRERAFMRALGLEVEP